MSVKPQKGATSRQMWLLPLLPHAHFRLSSYDAGVETTAATVLERMPDSPKTPVHKTSVTWLITTAIPETIEYRMNLCTELLPRVGKRMRSIAGKDRTRLAKRVRTMRSYRATRSRSEAAGSCLELTYPFYLGTLILVSTELTKIWLKARAMFL